MLKGSSSAIRIFEQLHLDLNSSDYPSSYFKVKFDLYILLMFSFMEIMVWELNFGLLVGIYLTISFLLIESWVSSEIANEMSLT